MAEIIRHIFATDRRGFGTEDDPVRMVLQLWTETGELQAEHDPATGKSWFMQRNEPNEDLRDAGQRVVDLMAGHRADQRGRNAPGHCHENPPKWDDRPGDCEWCPAWWALLDALKQ